MMTQAPVKINQSLGNRFTCCLRFIFVLQLFSAVFLFSMLLAVTVTPTTFVPKTIRDLALKASWGKLFIEKWSRMMQENCPSKTSPWYSIVSL
jgi:hypothetical protein